MFQRDKVDVNLTQTLFHNTLMDVTNSNQATPLQRFLFKLCFISVIVLHVFVPGCVSLLFIGAFLQYMKFILMIFFVAFIYDIAKYINPVLLYCCFKMC